MTRQLSNIGIIGGGFVGQVLKRYYRRARIYDIRPGPWDSLRDVLSQEYVFIAINLPDNATTPTGRDAIARYLDSLARGTRVVIKSTIAPGTTDLLQAAYPDIAIAVNPEFLTEATAWEDFSNPVFQILGLTPQSAPIAEELFWLLPPAPVTRAIGAREAETLKHALNSFFATKVIFFNQVYDACRILGADYEAVRALMVRHPWVGDSHSAVWHKGYRGFGGKCLPKDIRAFTTVAPTPLLEGVIAINESLRAIAASRGEAEIPPGTTKSPSVISARLARQRVLRQRMEVKTSRAA